MQSNIQIRDVNHNYAQVTDDGELHVCLCDNACLGTIRLKDLQRIYPGIRISIRKEQLGDGSGSDETDSDSFD